MKEITGQIMQGLIIQALISEVSMLNGVEFATTQWWYLVIGGSLVYNIGSRLRDNS